MSHYYDPKTGAPHHYIEKKDGSGLRPTTIRDARTHGWVPSVTTITKLLHQEQLVQWMIRNAALAIATAPRLHAETLDQFVDRVLNVEEQHEQEASLARDKGIAIHAAIALAVAGHEYDPALAPFVAPVVDTINKLGVGRLTEKIVLGNGYGGCMDCLLESDDAFLVLDFKTTKSLPKYSYDTHLLQLAAYAAAIGNTGAKRLRVGNIYISTTTPGELSICITNVWQQYAIAFENLLRYWQAINNFGNLNTNNTNKL